MNSEPILIGIDIGTTNLKAVAYDLAGRSVARSHASTPTCYPRPGWAYYEPDELWSRVASILRDVTAALGGGHQIAGLAITGMAEAGAPVDKDGNCVYPVIAWFDNRTQEQADWWQAEFGRERLYAIAGVPPLYIFGVNKIMWLKAHEPDAYARTARWLNMADFIAFRLSGAQATDYSLASRTLAFDLRTLCWSDELIGLAGVRPDLFARPVPSGTVVGQVTAEAAQATGLLAGVPVVSGGHDHLCGALAAGVIQSGDLLDSMGTAESLLMPLDKPVLTSEAGRAGYAQGVHVTPGYYYIMGGLYTSGACVDWVRDLLQLKSSSYAEFVALASQAPVGSGGVFFVPHLRMASAPYSDPKGRASFIGLSADSKTPAVARAVLEGMAYEAFHCASTVMQMAGRSTERYVVIGGGTRNELLMQIKAAVTNRDLQIVDTDEATTLGAALLAGMGVGAYRDATDAQQHLHLGQRVVSPDPVAASAYAERYEAVYVHIYQALRALHHTISDRFV